MRQGNRGKSNPSSAENELAIAKLEAKLAKIRNDVLFDAYTAEQQWQAKRIPLEKELAEAKRLSESQNDEAQPKEDPEKPAEPEENGEVNDEAERIAAEILAEAEGSDDGIEGLFDSLPQAEVDPATGQSQTIINGSDGLKTVIRDFGKWSGVSPRRALDEACRAR
jgi:ATP-dependent RNA helicase DHX29